MGASGTSVFVKNHSFIGGNKRTAFVAAAVFLLRNGAELTASEVAATAVMLDLAAGWIGEPEVARWLADHTTLE